MRPHPLLPFALVMQAVSGRLAIAQTAAPSPAAGTISGEVLDAGSERPLPNSTVVLRLVGDGAIVSAGPAPPTIIALARTSATDDSGHYRFAGLANGRYQLHVQRLGYRPATVEVEMRDADAARVSVGMVVVPVRLSPLPVNADPEPSFETRRTVVSDSAEAAARVRAARARQARYASTDVREITDVDLMETGSLGETDLFRALQRLPGITMRDDDDAQLWVRGMRGDETRVYFDGIPLFAPFHWVGPQAQTGVSSDAVGSAIIFPGVLPASMGDGVAALDLRSRPAEPDGKLRGIAELTSLEARVAMSRGSRDGSDWSLAARHEAHDIAGPIASLMAPGSASARDRAFFDDVTVRLSRPLSPSTWLRLTGVYSGDVVPGWLGSGNAGASATIDHDGGRFVAQHRISLSGYHSTKLSDRTVYGYYVLTTSPTGEPTSDTLQSRLFDLALSGQLRPAPANASWSAGYEVDLQRVANTGSVRRVVNATWVGQQVNVDGTLPIVSAWGERRWRIASWLDANGGLRIDGGASTAGAIRPMPRLTVRAAPDRQTTVTLSTGRSYQYAQAAGGSAVTGTLSRLLKNGE